MPSRDQAGAVRFVAPPGARRAGRVVRPRAHRRSARRPACQPPTRPSARAPERITTAGSPLLGKALLLVPNVSGEAGPGQWGRADKPPRALSPVPALVRERGPRDLVRTGAAGDRT